MVKLLARAAFLLCVAGCGRKYHPGRHPGGDDLNRGIVLSLVAGGLAVGVLIVVGFVVHSRRMSARPQLPKARAITR